jgi:oligopeptide transport system substrate-binding protein
MKRLFLFLSTLLFALTLDAGAADMVLKFNNLGEPKSLDPAILDGNIELELAICMYEGLMSYNPKDMTSVVPGVAEKFALSKDGLVYTFTLRKNAVWSDGTPVDAETFKYSWLRVLAPETAATYAYQLFYIKGAEAYNAGKGDAKGVGIEAVNKTTLKVTLNKPTPYFINLMAFPTYMPVPKQVIDKVGSDKWTLQANIVTNGPFKLTEWKPQQVIKLVKNDKYWDAAKVKLNTVYAYPTEDLNTAVEMYLNKEIDWSRDFADERIDELKATLGNQIILSPQLSTYYYRFNVSPTGDKAVKDIRVRRALSMSIARADIVKYVTKGGQQPALSIVPPMPGYKGFQTNKEDVAAAKKLLADAGYPDGKGFPKLTLMYNTSENHKRIAEAIQAMWKKNLGIDVELENVEWKVKLDREANLDYQISRTGWIGDYADPNTFLDMFTSYSGQNQTGWANKTYDDLIDKASREVDVKKRLVFLADAEKLLMEELPILPIYFYVSKNLLRPNVKGWYENILDLHPLKEVTVTP